MHPDPGLRNGVRIFVFASILHTCALLSTHVHSTQNSFFFASCFRCIAYVSARFLQVFSLAIFCHVHSLCPHCISVEFLKAVLTLLGLFWYTGAEGGVTMQCSCCCSLVEEMYFPRPALCSVFHIQTYSLKKICTTLRKSHKIYQDHVWVTF